MHTYIHTYIHTYMHSTYIHTCISSYMSICICNKVMHLSPLYCTRTDYKQKEFLNHIAIFQSSWYEVLYISFILVLQISTYRFLNLGHQYREISIIIGIIFSDVQSMLDVDNVLCEGTMEVILFIDQCIIFGN